MSEPVPANDTNSAAVDLAQRFVPSEYQRQVASAIMNADTTIRSVYVPIALPGKPKGVWQVGQVVEYPNGFWPVRNDDEAREARDDADHIAARFLAGKPGASAYCDIRRDGQWSVFVGVYGREAQP